MSPTYDTLGRLFSSDGFVPRRVCGRWPDWLVWEHVGGNALVWLAYLAMPLMIWQLRVRRPEWAKFRGVVGAFALFIGLCGVGHLLDLLACFRPMYRLSGHVLVVTGLASCYTVWSLRGAWPALMAMRSPAELERVIAKRTAELTRAIDDLERAEVDRSYLAEIVESTQDAIVGKDLDGILDTRLDDAQRGFAETIRGSGEALLTVINDILDFSKMEAGKLTLEATDFDLRALMGEVTDLLAPGAHRKGLEINCRVAPEVPERLVGDPVRVRQVLTNLAGNAVKFTDRGEVELEASLLAEDGIEATLRVLVRDTGIGIPAGRQADIFESFTQIEGGNSRRYGGTGLGLTICRSLVALMGGRIGLESRGGAGSTFWFEAAFAKGCREADPSLPDLDGLRVLIVDDHETNRAILRESLLSLKCRPESAGSGAEALARLLADPEDDPIRLILLDRDMPGMDGEQAARAIKAAPRFAGVPLVLLTSPGPPGSGEVDDGPWAARIAKPAHRSELDNTLRRAVAVPEPPRVRPPAADEEGGKPAPPLRILLAEDNEVNRRVAIGMAKRLGCEVEAVRDGREAVSALDHDRHDLVLMDVQMPEMDGFTATAAIRDRERGTGRHIPIIALTAHAMQGDRDRCLAAGMDGYMSKPIRPGPLREALRAWGGRHLRPSDDAGRPREPEPRSFSAEILGESCGGDPELTREVLELMLGGVPARLGRLETAVGAGDGRQVSWEAHGLKGAFATVGAGALAAACQDLVSLGERGDFAAIEEVYRAARDRWKGLKKEASRYLDTPTVPDGRPAR